MDGHKLKDKWTIKKNQVVSKMLKKIRLDVDENMTNESVDIAELIKFFWWIK